MGIKLDWQTSSGKDRQTSSGEDPASRAKRRSAQRRFVLFIIGIALAGIGIVGAALLRLREVDTTLQAGLRVSVENEVTALRLGDRAAFLDAQWRSEGDPDVTAGWVSVQQNAFDSYQTLKLQQDVTLTGRVLDVTLDGQNGRVHIEEIIDGVPYGVIWFYWRFDEGWRHVPPAYGFWGDAGMFEDAGERFAVVYRSVDAPIAAAMATELPRGFDALCALFACGGLPAITVEIVPDPDLTPGWSADDPWRVRLPSPYVTRARLDIPFEGALRSDLAGLITRRWTDAITVDPGTDAAYLRGAVEAYLIEEFSGVDTGSHLITSLIENYGTLAAARLIDSLTPDTRIGVLGGIASEPLDVIRLDWRDYLGYLLRREGASGIEVTSVIRESTAEGRTALRAIVTGQGIGTTEIVFVLTEENQWRRAE
ncbi:MAG: hypothetical protein SGJ24_11820 [Chloroflexota bacterium]|nr:hypothetical protein [Chloroflexota bacterium]